MRYIPMIVAVATTLSANEIYEVQLLYAKSSNPKVLSAYVQKGTDAGLVCESRQIEDHYVVRCDRTSNYKEAKKSLKKAKKANIDYCLKRVKEKDIIVSNEIKDINNNMFGKNNYLSDLFEGKKRVSKPEDIKKREEFLEKVKNIYLSRSKNFWS